MHDHLNQLDHCVAEHADYKDDAENGADICPISRLAHEIHAHSMPVEVEHPEPLREVAMLPARLLSLNHRISRRPVLSWRRCLTADGRSASIASPVLHFLLFSSTVISVLCEINNN